MFVFRFGSDPRETMISNQLVPKLGPGPAAHDPLKSLKNVIVQKTKMAVVMKKPH